MYTEYECDVQESQRRPANLLDALERDDNCSEEDKNSVLIMEKVTCSLSVYILSNG